jgi:Xaa-Pro aminopeptidase
MTSLFAAEFFTENRTRLRHAIGSDVPIIITGNGSMQRAADEPFKFTQDSNFWYLTGLTAPELTLVMTAKGDFLIVPALSLERQVFDGAHDLAAFMARSGIQDVVGERDGWQRVRETLADKHQAATLAAIPSYLSRYRMFSLPYRRRLIAKLKRLDSSLVVQDIRSQLAQLRALKQPSELAALQRAIDITTETLHDVSQAAVLHGARHEYELEAAISYGFRRRGADGHAFEPIVGAGAHATTLHHIDNTGPITPGDFIVLDVGASVEHYAADITRTVSQQPLSKRQQQVFDAVASVQDYALSLLKPGTLLHDYEAAVADHMGGVLRDLGLIDQPTPDAIRRHFPHATSHFLGLDTHDVGDYARPLAAGMVITCEPGIYIPEENIGVRIEDDILITETGYQNLSGACPRALGHLQ